MLPVIIGDNEMIWMSFSNREVSSSFVIPPNTKTRLTSSRCILGSLISCHIRFVTGFVNHSDGCDNVFSQIASSNTDVVISDGDSMLVWPQTFCHDWSCSAYCDLALTEHQKYVASIFPPFKTNKKEKLNKIRWYSQMTKVYQWIKWWIWK